MIWQQENANFARIYDLLIKKGFCKRRQYMNMRKIPYPPRLRNVLLKKTATVIGKLRYHFFNLTEKEIKDWNNIFSSLLKMPPRTHFKIAKGMVNAPPWHVSKMGFSKRALRQFRSDHQFKGIHI